MSAGYSPALRYVAQTFEAVCDCCASNFAKLARRPGSRIFEIGPQVGLAEEPAGAVTAAKMKAAKAEMAMMRKAVMARSPSPETSPARTDMVNR